MNHFLELLLECRININFTHFMFIVDLYHKVYKVISIIKYLHNKYLR